MTPRQLKILQHAVGADQYGRIPHPDHGSRNHFCAGGDDEPVCRELVALGFMRQHRTTEVFPYFNCSVTDEGRNAMRESSPVPPKLTRSQKRYREWLSSGAADCGFSFGEYIKRGSGRAA